jgi:hypothetical protein
MHEVDCDQKTNNISLVRVLLTTITRLTQLFNAVLALETLSRVHSLFAVLEMVLGGSAGLGLAALCGQHSITMVSGQRLEIVLTFTNLRERL